jgi:hypothetical protein
MCEIACGFTGLGMYLRVCRLTYPACNAQASYCRLHLPWLYHIFGRYLAKGMIFGEKKVTEREICVFVLCKTFV